MNKSEKFAADFNRGFADALTLGLAELAFKGHRLTHDVIEAHVRCQCRGCEKNGCMAKNGNICNSNPYYTLDYRNSGSNMKIGYCANTLHVDKEYEPNNMNLRDLKWVYKFYEDDGSSYHCISYNCKDWAKKVYDKIKKKY